MTGFRLLTPAEDAEWEAALPARASVFGSAGFARVTERSGGTARLLVVADGPNRAAYPLQLRPLADLPFPVPDIGGRWDSASPPFTGPYLRAGEATPALREAITAALAAEGVVAEFAHLHPWAGEPGLVAGGAPDREIVWVDVTLGEEALWSDSYSRACRKNVRRAEREGVTVRPAADAADIAAFHSIYIRTMERNEAHPSYFYDLAYFEAIFAELPANARFALAEHEGKVIAATLYLHDDQDVYSYLGGANHDHQALRPTNAVVHDTIRWARGEGKRRLVLGGGYRPGDGIFRFKASFSPLRATLRLARRIHRRADYDALVAARGQHAGSPADSGYFPAYRASG